MKQPKSGGGWQAVRYSLRKANEVGAWNFWKALRSKNACKTCAFGMGGQMGGMVNEGGHFPEVCKKSMQAMTADMQGRIESKFFETYTVDQLKGFSSRELEAMGRLVEPVIAEGGSDHYQVISWDDAFSKIGAALKATKPERAFFYSSGRSSNEAGFLMQLMARCYGTNHVNNCSYYCHQASGVGLNDSIGTGTATIELDDLEKCDLVFLIGANPASNHPRLMTVLMHLRRRGGKVIVVNPLREVGLTNFKVPSNPASMLFGSEIASLYVQPTIGGDCGLFMGMAKRLLEVAAIDHCFIENWTEGFEPLRALVEETSWEQVESSSGLSREEIEKVADEYARSEKTVFAWAMGITHHLHGVENVQWIANLALLRGMVGKEGTGLMPIRGHSNVQGLGSIGVSPAMKDAALKALEADGIKPPELQRLRYDVRDGGRGSGRSRFCFLFGRKSFWRQPGCGVRGAEHREGWYCYLPEHHFEHRPRAWAR